MAHSMLDLEAHGYHNYSELEKAESNILDKLDTVQRDLVDAEINTDSSTILLIV